MTELLSREAGLAGEITATDVHEVLRRVYDFADRVRSGAWTAPS